jgi:hypothetical protein
VAKAIFRFVLLGPAIGAFFVSIFALVSQLERVGAAPANLETIGSWLAFICIFWLQALFVAYVTAGIPAALAGWLYMSATRQLRLDGLPWPQRALAGCLSGAGCTTAYCGALFAISSGRGDFSPFLHWIVCGGLSGACCAVTLDRDL